MVPPAPPPSPPPPGPPPGLIVTAGAPKVLLFGLSFSGFAQGPAVAVTGGALHMMEVAFENNSASAIVVSGGECVVEGGRFEHNVAVDDVDGGAMRLLGGRVDLQGGTFAHNSGRNGGAVFVNGSGDVWLSAATFTDNIAAEKGGAMFVTHARATLANGSLVKDSNRASADGSGHSTYGADGAIIAYTLPAPSGYWIANAEDCSELPARATPACGRGLYAGYQVWRISSAAEDSTLPFLCSAGYIGSDAERQETQIGPSCSGYCPASYYCPGGLSGPVLCPTGAFCPAGVPAGVPCPAGTFNEFEGQSSADACVVCTEGHYCGTGESVQQACPADTYQGLRGQINSTTCSSCPGVAITASAATTSSDACICPKEYYADWSASGGDVSCLVCVAGTDCAESGATLLALKVEPTYYRHTNRSIDVRSCRDGGTANTSGCLGGALHGKASCRDGLAGVFCELCASWLDGNASSKREYYSPPLEDQPAQCLSCSSLRLALGSSMRMAMGLFVLTPLILLALYKVLPKGALDLLARLRRTLFETFTVPVKLKLIIGFYQIVTRFRHVYVLTYPAIVGSTLGAFESIISFGLENLPFACIGASSYLTRLTFWVVAPPVFTAIPVFSIWVATKLKLRSAQREGTLLPITLRVLFIAYPIVTNHAFDGFSCILLDGGSEVASSWLSADTSVRCDTEHRALWAVAPLAGRSEFASGVTLAWFAIFIYPVGVPLLIAVVLYRGRKAIATGRSTQISRSTRFLHDNLKKSYFWWEIAEVLRRFLLVGAFILGPYPRGSTMQISLALVVSALYLVLQVVAMPYATYSDNFLAMMCSLGMTMFLLAALILKVNSLVELPEVAERLSEEMDVVYNIDFAALTGVLMACVLCAVVAAAVLLNMQFVAEQARQRHEALAAKARRLRSRPDGTMVHAPPIEQGGYHLFLSHVWGTGQDQMRVIKQRLLEMVPELSIFLDVDDLEDISDLQGYIERSSTVLIFCSKGYFFSRNCMIELRSSVMKGKRIMPLVEPLLDRGGLTQKQIHDDLVAADAFYAKWGFEGDGGPRSDELMAALFSGELEPVEWNRIGAFQDVTMRLIATIALRPPSARLLNVAPTPISRKKRNLRSVARLRSLRKAGSSSEASMTTSDSESLAAIDSPTEGSLAEGSLAERSVSRTPPSRKKAKHKLWTDEELYLEGELARTVNVSLSAPTVHNHDFHCYCSPHNPGAFELMKELNEKMPELDVQITRDATEGRPNAGCLVVYLTGQTWTGGARSAAFAEEVSAAMEAKIPVLMAHEMPGSGGQDERHGVEFGTFFSCDDGATPTELLKAGIYNMIAVPLKGGKWREASMVMLAEGLRDAMGDSDEGEDARHFFARLERKAQKLLLLAARRTYIAMQRAQGKEVFEQELPGWMRNRRRSAVRQRGLVQQHESLAPAAADSGVAALESIHVEGSTDEAAGVGLGDPGGTAPQYGDVGENAPAAEAPSAPAAATRQTPGRMWGSAVVVEPSAAPTRMAALGRVIRSTGLQLKRRPRRLVKLVKTPLGLGMELGADNTVSSVQPHSQAERGGIKVGDVVLTIDGAPCRSSEELTAAMRDAAVGRTLVLGVGPIPSAAEGPSSSSSRLSVQHRRRPPSAAASTSRALSAALPSLPPSSPPSPPILSPTLSPRDDGVLLESWCHVRPGTASPGMAHPGDFHTGRRAGEIYALSLVQLHEPAAYAAHAAPGASWATLSYQRPDGSSCGLSYDDVRTVRVIEAALEFIVELQPSVAEATGSSLGGSVAADAADGAEARLAVRLSTMNEFNAWRQMLQPKIAPWASESPMRYMGYASRQSSSEDDAATESPDGTVVVAEVEGHRCSGRFGGFVATRIRLLNTPEAPHGVAAARSEWTLIEYSDLDGRGRRVVPCDRVLAARVARVPRSSADPQTPRAIHELILQISRPRGGPRFDGRRTLRLRAADAAQFETLRTALAPKMVDDRAAWAVHDAQLAWMASVEPPRGFARARPAWRTDRASRANSSRRAAAALVGASARSSASNGASSSVASSSEDEQQRCRILPEQGVGHLLVRLRNSKRRGVGTRAAGSSAPFTTEQWPRGLHVQSKAAEPSANPAALNRARDFLSRREELGAAGVASIVEGQHAGSAPSAAEPFLIAVDMTPVREPLRQLPLSSTEAPWYYTSDARYPSARRRPRNEQARRR